MVKNPINPQSAFGRFLEENRAELNQKFLNSKLYYPKLDAENFKRIICDVMAPALEACSDLPQDKFNLFAKALYNTSLELYGKEYIGESTKFVDYYLYWQELVVQLSKIISQSPAQMIAALSNALYSLSIVYEGRLEEWVKILIRVSQTSSNYKVLLDAGKLASWRCGLAHFRISALELAKTMDKEIVSIIFDIPKDTDYNLEGVISKMLANPWLAMGDAILPTNKKLDLVCQKVGGFTGLGSKFKYIPVVTQCNENEFTIEVNYSTKGDGNSKLSKQTEFFRLFADAYGTSIIPCKEKPNYQTIIANPLKIDAIKNSAKKEIKELSKPASYSSNSTTLLLTLPYSYHLYIVR